MRFRSTRTPEVVIATVLAAAFATAGTQTYVELARGKAKPKRPYALKSSVGPRTPVFRITDAAPGDQGQARVLLQNIGAREARIVQQRTRTTRSALDPWLQLSVYDATTRQCLYPAPPAPRRKKAKRPKRATKARPARHPRPSGPCTTLAPWERLPGKLTLMPKPRGRFVVRGTKGMLWKRKERHNLVVRWRIAPDAPNAAAGQTSSFTLRWRALRR